MKFFVSAFISLVALSLIGCGGGASNSNNTTAGNTAVNSPEVQNLAVAERPQKIKDLMTSRGEQDAAAPTLKIIEPKDNATLNTATVKVKLEISGDLKGYAPGMNDETHTGNHIHVILDNQPYEAYYNLGREFELRNVADGEHVIRVFPSRPWHESYKNAGAFQMVKFTVKGGGAFTDKPTTVNGNTVANAATPVSGPTPEAKEMKKSVAGFVDAAKPLLTYSRPKGEYKGDDAAAIMIDFWLANAKLKDEGGEYRVRYTVDNGEHRFIDKWEPIWLTGWAAGKHTIVMELIDGSGKAVDNGGFNSTVREITITR